MPTVPTDKMERELRKAFLAWSAGIGKHEDDLTNYVNTFETKSRGVIRKWGGLASSLGAVAGFPVPKTLELSPVAGVVYDNMRQAVIAAGITAGINSRETARAMLNAGLGKNYKRLERLARTETTNAYWKNSWSSVAELPAIVMLWGSEESKRTCEYCLSRDGLVVEDSKIRDHPNGRCTLIPTLRSRVEYKGTLRSDGTVYQDPAWTGKPAPKSVATAGPTTAEQRDTLSGKSNPAALNTSAPATAQATEPKVRVIKTVKDMEDFGKGMPVPSTITPKAAVIMDDYAKGTAYTANAVLRGQKTYLGRPIDARTKAYTKTFTKEMDKMMDASRIPEDVRVVRTVRADAFGGIEELKKLAGTTYQDKGYMSTSLAEKVSSKVYSAADGIEMEIVVPKGTKGLYMAGESYLKSERELLLNRGTKLDIQAVIQDPKSGKWTVQARVVPDTPAEVIKPPAQPSANGTSQSNAQKLKNAGIMFGTDSPQYRTALAKWGPK